VIAPSFRSGNAGTYRWIGASRSSRPSDHNFSTATAVIALVLLAAPKTVSVDAGTLCSRSACPSAPWYASRLPRPARAIPVE